MIERWWSSWYNLWRCILYSLPAYQFLEMADSSCYAVMTLLCGDHVRTRRNIPTTSGSNYNNHALACCTSWRVVISHVAAWAIIALKPTQMCVDWFRCQALHTLTVHLSQRILVFWELTYELGCLLAGTNILLMKYVGEMKSDGWLPWICHYSLCE